MEVEFGAVGETSRFVELVDVNYNEEDTLTFKLLNNQLKKYEVYCDFCFGIKLFPMIIIKILINDKFTLFHINFEYKFVKVAQSVTVCSENDGNKFFTETVWQKNDDS